MMAESTSRLGSFDKKKIKDEKRQAMVNFFLISTNNNKARCHYASNSSESNKKKYTKLRRSIAWNPI